MNDENEILDIVNKKGEVIGKATRLECHGNPKLLHQVVHIHVFNKKGQLYLQKRAGNKTIQPLKWDTSVGGHIDSGESIQTAAYRELQEELGIAKTRIHPLFQYIFTNEIESEFVHAFYCLYNGRIQINKAEIDKGSFWEIARIEKNLKNNIFTPNFIQEYSLVRQHLHKINIVFNLIGMQQKI